MVKIFDLESREIRKLKAAKLVFPDPPKYVSVYEKHTLINILERYGDYWAAWYQKASFFSDIVSPEHFSTPTLRRLIKLVSDDDAAALFAMNSNRADLWETHLKPFFDKWDKIVEKELPKAKNAQTRQIDMEYNDLYSSF